MKADKVEPTYALKERVIIVARNDHSQQTDIEELIVSHIDPVIKRILFQRLRLYFNGSRGGGISLEAEDVYQTVILKLFGNPKVRDLALLHNNIDELQKYTAVVAHNVCNDFFRTKYPERSRLKDKIRDLLRRHPDFASWKESDRTLCGFANWIGRHQSSKAEKLILELDKNCNGAEIEGLNLVALAGSRLSKLIADLFYWCQGPIDTDDLIYIVAKLQRIKDQPAEPLNCDNLAVQRIADPVGSHHEYIEARDLLLGLWAGLLDLPHNQRKTFIYTSQDQKGESLLHRMLREQVIKVSQIYDVLELTRAELIEIWNMLPMDTQTAAMTLGVTRGVVAKWRHRAMKKLAVKLGVGNQ